MIVTLLINHFVQNNLEQTDIKNVLLVNRGFENLINVLHLFFVVLREMLFYVGTNVRPMTFLYLNIIIFFLNV